MLTSVNNSHSVLLIFWAYEVEASITEFKGLRLTFTLKFFIKYISADNFVKKSCILYKHTYSFICFNLNTFLTFFAYLQFRPNIPLVFSWKRCFLLMEITFIFHESMYSQHAAPFLNKDLTFLKLFLQKLNNLENFDWLDFYVFCIFHTYRGLLLLSNNSGQHLKTKICISICIAYKNLIVFYKLHTFLIIQCYHLYTFHNLCNTCISCHFYTSYCKDCE